MSLRLHLLTFENVVQQFQHAFVLPYLLHHSSVSEFFLSVCQ